jgi:putative acetyltransferase
MMVRRIVPSDRAALLDIWLRSVRATHAFLTEADIQFFLPKVQGYLAAEEPDFWVLCSDADTIMGFMGLSPNRIDALFLAPEYFRQGGGRRMVQHALSLFGNVVVDVNEQNPDACRFYEACGFVVQGRSELDDTGRPFPILHMRYVGVNAQ